jgi:single-strand DNA-binding protein
MNNVQLIGILGQDPEMKYFESGSVKASFSIALDEYVKDKEKKTIWINIEAWAKTAETIVQYFKKGSKIGVSGRLSVEKWKDIETGLEKSKTFIVAKEITFCDKKQN